MQEIKKEWEQQLLPEECKLLFCLRNKEVGSKYCLFINRDSLDETSPNVYDAFFLYPWNNTYCKASATFISDNENVKYLRLFLEYYKNFKWEVHPYPCRDLESRPHTTTNTPPQTIRFGTNANRGEVSNLFSISNLNGLDEENNIAQEARNARQSLA